MIRFDKKRLSMLLSAFMVLIVVIIFTYFIKNQRSASDQVNIGRSDIDIEAALILNQLTQRSKKEGITEWELNADSAKLFREQNKAVLEMVHVTFFTRDKEEVHLKSQKGTLNTKSHDMTFSDHVVVTHEGGRLRTDQLQYNKKKHIITSASHVKFDKFGSVIEGDSMHIDLNTNTIILTGNVKGRFIEDFKF